MIAADGLFRYDGARIAKVEGEEQPGFDLLFHDVPGGLLVTFGDNGLLLYDGTRVVQVGGDPTGTVNKFQDTPGVLLVGAEKGLFRYGGARTVRVTGDQTGAFRAFHDVPGGLLVGAEKGLFRYDGARVVQVGGDPTGTVNKFQDTPGGLLLGAQNGLFRYDGSRVLHVEGKLTGAVYALLDIPGGLLVGAENGLFRYDGAHIVRVEGGPKGAVIDFHDAPGGPLLLAGDAVLRYDGARVVPVEGVSKFYANSFRNMHFRITPTGMLLGIENSLYRYDGTLAIPVGGEPTSDVNDFHDTLGGLLVAAMNGLFRYDGERVTRVAGAPTGPVYGFHEGLGGLLLAAQNGLFRVVLQPLTTSKVDLNNRRELNGVAPSQLGIPTHWTMTHPCSAFADQFSLHVVATNDKGQDLAMMPAIGFHPRGDAVSFEATVPVVKDGKWTFRIVSMTAGAKTNIGKHSEAIAFVAPVTPGFLGWLARWWRVIAANSAALWAVLNLLVFGGSRYSAAAWRLATDELWGKKALFLQNLLLRHWQSAQLWLLDLYVQERRTALADKSIPFLALPLTSSYGKIADSDAVIANVASARHVWVQGGAGMGKTAIFLHLRQAHFGGAETTAFAIFRRDGYVLVPIEARRFPEAPSDEKSSSAWVVACVLSILSEGRVSFEDRGLLRAMLSMGTLGVAIDGLNEVAREQAVNAFVAEFPATPLFVTSQESGELPFEVWHLPGTISQHVDGLLTLYLGRQRGEALARRLRDTGLFQHLRSGYDVRLVIDLAEADSEGANLPCDRLGLYRAAVAAAWPEGDERLELLQAAAWKLMSERGPNEDKRRLKPEMDAPKDLLEQLEAVRERWGRSIRLIRGAPPGYEFVHDQMNAYLAACWFADRPTVAVMKELLETTKVWQDGLEAQRTLWGFVAAMVDRPRLEALWIFAGDDDRRAVLGRALAERAEREGWSLTRPPAKVTMFTNSSD
ncbi:MAG: hypothetical protein M3178_11325 [Pseudomonadota bacterium]|nr:hypothetical protein [Pseudomonadota bacterium]